jgi:hypothetical protein
MATDHVSTLGESFKLVDQIDTRRGCWNRLVRSNKIKKSEVWKLEEAKISIFQVTLLETVFLCRELSSDSWQKNKIAGMMNLALQSL